MDLGLSLLPLSLMTTTSSCLTKSKHFSLLVGQSDDVLRQVGVEEVEWTQAA